VSISIFPNRVVDDNGAACLQGGLSLRDYVAAQAVIGLSSRSKEIDSQGVAQKAYAIADAMIKERGP